MILLASCFCFCPLLLLCFRAVKKTEQVLCEIFTFFFSLTFHSQKSQDYLDLGTSLWTQHQIRSPQPLTNSVFFWNICNFISSTFGKVTHATCHIYFLADHLSSEFLGRNSSKPVHCRLRIRSNSFEHFFCLPFLLALMIGHSISVEFFCNGPWIWTSFDFCWFLWTYGSFSFASHEASIWGSLRFPFDLFRVIPDQSWRFWNATHFGVP